MKALRRPIARIAKYTLMDEVRQRSFIVLFLICVAFLLLSRSCYQGGYVVNGEAVDASAVAGAVSRVAFHVVSLVSMLVAVLISMRVLRRDRDGGMQSAILSKPVTRSEYLLGKVAGLWALSSAFMLCLQAIVFIVAALVGKAVLPGLFAAALLACIDLLFLVIAVLLLSLLMPEMAAFLCILGIGVVGLIVDVIYAVGSSPVAQAVTGSSPTGLSLGKILYYVWPKVAGLEAFASSFINGAGFPGFSSAYPLANILLYCLLLGALLSSRFRKEEIV